MTTYAMGDNRIEITTKRDAAFAVVAESPEGKFEIVALTNNWKSAQYQQKNFGGADAKFHIFMRK